ncbi:hypothetical protein [Candidatus Villigracilis affinis]|nr:hypothetical protein [Anaerolineales bacterium]
MDVLSNFLTLGIVFLLTLAFGFWLSRIGKPYNGFLSISTSCWLWLR